MECSPHSTIDQTIMHCKNLMDLPELRLLVGQHLSDYDIGTCMLVCKSWHETFASCLWSKYKASFDLCFDFCNPDRRVWSNIPGGGLTTKGQRDTFIKHSHRIRDLRLDHVGEINETRKLLEFFVSTCTSLKAFSYILASRELPMKKVSSDDLVQKMIEQNPGLQSLSTSAISCLQPPLLSVLSNLRTLEIRVELSVDDSVFILAALPSLHDLTLYNSFSPHSRLSSNTRDRDQMRLSSSSMPSPSSSLQRLTIVYATDIFELGHLLEQCPNLRHLCFEDMQYRKHRLLDILRPGLLPHLKSLTLNKCHLMNRTILVALGSQSFTSLTSELPCITTLRSIAQYHAHQVEHLSLTMLPTSGHSVLVILAQCPGLRTLKVDLYVYDHSLIDIRDLIREEWKCTLLEELVLPISLNRWHIESSLKYVAADEKASLANTSKMTEWQQAEAVFMKRLGSLTRLRRLELKSRIHPCSKPLTELSLQLTAGFGHLKHLHRLETLKLIFQEYHQGLPEFQWMRQNFRSLSTLVVYDVGDNNRRQWMRKLWPELSVVEVAVVNPSYAKQSL